jgi:serine protease Do
VPINIAKDILGALRTQGHVSRGYLGIQLQDLDPDLQALVRTKETAGAVVLDVLTGEAGEAAGLKRYDVITEVSGKKVDDGDALVRQISNRAPGTTVALTVVRDGRPLQLRPSWPSARSRTMTKTTTPRTGSRTSPRRATPSASSRRS